ncbi:general transcription factor 3C polypeptide 5-like [Saccostrea cucullata]|uniref:general transcription factor 3C polypeptide 5-like n=1 Tax=Saccostrea cuccullata TaxID=36930 RepID=UPI002ED5705F
MELEKAHNWTDFDKLTTVSYNKNRKFMCIEYPGIVKNVDKALETLGGIPNIERVYANVNKRVDVNFRPSNAYCKPAFGERTVTSSLYMKVKRRRKKGEKSWENCQFQVEVLGSVESMYKFNSMADFQYLPVLKGPSGELEQIHDRLVYRTFVDRNEFLDRDVPSFLPPVIFSRFDYPDKDYLYRDGITHREGYMNPEKDRPANLIGTVRERRKVYTVFLNFNDDVPEKPRDEALAHLRLKYNEPEREKEIYKLFEQRPIWSRVALHHYFSGKREKVKYLLPMKACYYLNGPWRCMWVKFGYDPRKHPEAKIYQTVDYRVRQTSPGEKMGVALKRSPNVIAFPAMKRKNTNIVKINLTKSRLTDEKDESSINKEPLHVYTPDRLPPCRQMFYQMCDIKVDEIQTLIRSNTASVCTEKEGWCHKGIIEKCREIMTKKAQQLIEKKGLSVAQHLGGTKEKHKPKTPMEDDAEMEDLGDEDDDDMDDLNDDQQTEDDVNEMETEMLDCV